MLPANSYLLDWRHNGYVERKRLATRRQRDQVAARRDVNRSSFSG